MLAGDALEGRPTVPGGHDRETGVFEVVAGKLDDLGFVVDNEDGGHRGLAW